MNYLNDEVKSKNKSKNQEKAFEFAVDWRRRNKFKKPTKSTFTEEELKAAYYENFVLSYNDTFVKKGMCLVSWDMAVQIHKLFEPESNPVKPDDIKLKFAHETWSRNKRSNIKATISGAGAGNSNHHIIPEGDLQGIFVLLEKEFIKTDNDLKNRVETLLENICNIKHFAQKRKNKTGSFLVPLERASHTNFAWIPCNLFQGPDGNHRTDDPGSSRETKKPKSFPSTIWQNLDQVYRVYIRAKSDECGENDKRALVDALSHLLAETNRLQITDAHSQDDKDWECVKGETTSSGEAKYRLS